MLTSVALIFWENPLKRRLIKAGIAALALATIAGGTCAVAANAAPAAEQGQFWPGVGLTKLSPASSTKVHPGDTVVVSALRRPGPPSRSEKPIVLDYLAPNGLDVGLEVVRTYAADGSTIESVTVPATWAKGKYTLQSVEQVNYASSYGSVQLRDGESIGLSTFGADRPRYGKLDLNLKALDLTVR